MKLKAKEKKLSNRQRNLERLYGELAVAQHNYENAVAHTAEGSNDNQDRWMRRAEFWLGQIETIAKTIESIETNDQKRKLTTGEKISIGASLVLPIFGTVAQWLPYTEKGTALVNRLSERAERKITDATRNR